MRARLIPLAALLAAAGPARAVHPPPIPEHTQERAGNPQCVAPWAMPGRSDKDAVGYVGGGCLGVCKGEARRCDEGTFGWDYVGCRKYGHVFLSWCHCRKQPEPGPYKSDGPHVPDIFSVHPILNRILGREHQHLRRLFLLA